MFSYEEGVKKSRIYVMSSVDSKAIICKILREKYGILDLEIKGITFGDDPGSYEECAAELARILNSFKKEIKE